MVTQTNLCTFAQHIVIKKMVSGKGLGIWGRAWAWAWAWRARELPAVIFSLNWLHSGWSWSRLPSQWSEPSLVHPTSPPY